MSGTGDSVTRGKPVAYWATLEHYRTWLAADAGHRKQVEEDGDLELLVEDDKGGLLALADLRATLLPLTVGAPEPVAVAAIDGRSPEGDRVDAPVSLAAFHIHRAGDARF